MCSVLILHTLYFTIKAVTVVQVQIYSEMSLQNCWSVQMMPLLNISFCVFSQELLHLHHQTHRR